MMTMKPPTTHFLILVVILTSSKHTKLNQRIKTHNIAFKMNCGMTDYSRATRTE